MTKCKTCAHSVFDERWGEYKCKLAQHRIYNPDECNKCKDYKEDKTKGEVKDG